MAPRDRGAPPAARRFAGAGIAVAMLVLAWIDTAGAQYLTSGGSAPPASAPEWMPAWLADLLRWVVAMQDRFHDGLTSRIREARDGGITGAAVGLVGVSFLYGVFHAAGPGHGKAVVTSYFLSHRSRYWRGAAMGAAIAAVQAFSAVVIVLGLGLVLQLSRAEMLRNLPLLETASYALIVVLGLAMLVGIARGRGCCHEGREHGHRGPDGGSRILRPGILQMALAVGLRPCTGALIVLLFAMANGLLLLGLAGVAAMAVGVALTTSAVGMGVIGARRGLVGIMGQQSRTAAATRTGLQLLGSFMVLAIGILLFMGSWQRTGASLF